MRAFVAVEMSEPIRDEVSRVIERLRRLGGSITWVRAKNLHVTLKFLGDVREENLPRVSEILRRCLEGAPPFEVEVRGAGAFPSLQRPRVLFVDAHDAPPTLAAVAERLNDRMAAAGVPREDRPFRNHVTVGRVRKPLTTPDLADELGKLADRDFGRMTVSEAVLMKSDLGADGPVYTALERVPLRANA